jgi:putative membrane protein
MYYGNGFMFGMHWIAWIFWILLLALLVILIVRLAPVSGRNVPPPGPSGPTPREILDRRYASGEITTQEYEERKAKLAEK